LRRASQNCAVLHEFDFVADNPELTLFHCHQQLHMDFGFMALFNYAQAIRDP
jgi:FtsP/CotA-like multicopper oxidase with cupredoxin domain